MKPSRESIGGFGPGLGKWVPTVLCWLLALPVGLAGLLAALFQMIANMNLHLGRPVHCIIFLVGWMTAACCFFSVYWLVRHPSYRSLWWVLVSGGMFALDFWLFSLPAAGGLIH